MGPRSEFKRIETKVTELFDIDYPIVQGGMIWVSGWRLASAVSNAGGLGVLGSGSMEPELLAEHITKLKKACDRPYGVNVPVMNTRSSKLIDVCLRNEVPIVFTSAGDPNTFVGRLKDSGTVVAHVVPSAKYAKKVEEAGCDVVVAEGTEAGGHNGYQEIASVVLWPSVVDAVKIPVIAAGGIADGRGMVAAMALGAQGVQLGTRFALAEESSAHPDYKAAGIMSTQGDIPLYLRSCMPTRAISNDFVKSALVAEVGGASREELLNMRGHGRAKRGIFEGDLEQGELEIGQVASSVADLCSASSIMHEILREYENTITRLIRGVAK